jgi:2-amino-4-hydroxy-6-hydroxymethyldihydropteridine diphosphokinase
MIDAPHPLPHLRHPLPDAQKPPARLPEIAIGLGANLGPRRAALNQACRLLVRRGIRIGRRSRLYWTRPWGVTDQPEFLNAVVAVETTLPPSRLLDALLQIENEMGRRRLARWGPRRIDLDLLLYGSHRIDVPELVLPHPGIARRDFVIAPLLDLGFPPPPAIAPSGWRRLLADLPRVERTIIRNQSW